MRLPAVGCAVVLVLGGCASEPARPGAVASKEGAVVGYEQIGVEEGAALDWARLEAAVEEAARDRRLKLPREKVHAAAIAYAKDINRIPEVQMRQFHIDRAVLVLEREVFSGETLAEGANLRATVSGGSAGGRSGSSRSSRGSRDIGRTSGTSSTGRTTGTTGSGSSNQF